MCCIRIDTDVLLANFFAQKYPANKKFCASIDVLEDYLLFLSGMFSQYLATDFCEQKVEECIAKYPQLYRRLEANSVLLVVSGNLVPNLEYFNALYSDEVSKYIQKVTKVYLQSQRPATLRDTDRQ